MGVRERIEEGNRRIRALKRVDRAARAVIVAGGLAVVASVVGILLFIAAEALPLFLAPRAAPATTVRLPAVPLAVGVDEYQLYAYVVRPDANVELVRVKDGSSARVFPLTRLADAPTASPAPPGGPPPVPVAVQSASRALHGDWIAAGTADGRVALARLRFEPRYEAQKLVDLDVQLEERGVAAVDAARRPVRQVSYLESEEGAQVVAALVDESEVALWTATAAGAPGTLATLRTPPGEAITAVRLGRPDTLAVATRLGRVYHWELGEAPRLTDVSPVSTRAVTALEWIVGGTTFVAGDEAGELSGWFRTRLSEDEHPVMVRAHRLPAHGAPIAALAASPRDRSFAAVGRDGSLGLYFMTSERRLLSVAGDGGREPVAALVTPKTDGLVVGRADGTLTRHVLEVPHPEVTWQALFGRLWYEGYPGASWVWQSTGATSDFEAKFSLYPLVFGTIKATVYALLFAVPLAVLGALYTSQFAHPDLRSRIKPAVEIMAALPSVVIGFVAGLWLAPLVERVVVPVLLMVVLLPLFGTSGVLLWKVVPRPMARRLRAGTELGLVLVLLLLAAVTALTAGPWVEATFFRGDFKLWLSTTWGMTFDQRNSLVVGLAMGFAVIPLIFTIADDAFSSVPTSLTAASLALGASRWQTAVRVVLPTASPGVFSAVMIGFGRAVGETMIVLMATGNTPVLDWSPFNGMRTLSANIAVEIPEAPHGGTLYRILFLAAALLFALTFVVNTLAELVRQRLRERYRAL